MEIVESIPPPLDRWGDVEAGGGGSRSTQVTHREHKPADHPRPSSSAWSLLLSHIRTPSSSEGLSKCKAREVMINPSQMTSWNLEQYAFHKLSGGLAALKGLPTLPFSLGSHSFHVT